MYERIIISDTYQRKRELIYSVVFTVLFGGQVRQIKI